MKKILFILIITIQAIIVYPKVIYVSSTGNDSNAGTIDKPVESIQKAQEKVSAGDTVYIRGGNYKIRSEQISRVENDLFACISYLNKSGLPGKTIKYWAYPGETPVFDFSDIKPANQRVVGIWVSGEYIHIKGLEMTGIQTTITTHTESYCIYSRGNNNIFEQLSMHNNKGTGIRHYKGGNNLFLNCDAYLNHDDVSEDKKGGNNDGFGCHPDKGSTGNVFRGCRAWFNSDDGFDCIRADEAIVFDSCWAFYNGYSGLFVSLGDGNGFKAGGYAYDEASKIPSPVPKNTIKFCVAVKNKANGFYSNHHLAGNNWYNNSAYQNSSNYNMVNRESPASDNINVDGYGHILINNLSHKPRGSHYSYINKTKCTLEKNSFDLSVTINDEDFVSLVESDLTKSRKADGSLPDIDFLTLDSTNTLIDKGIYIGFDYNGNAPDLGAFESVYVKDTSINEDTTQNQDSITFINKYQAYSFKIYPNPANSRLYFNLENFNRIEIFDLLGNKQQFFMNKTFIDISAINKGMYIIKIYTQDQNIISKVFIKK